MGLTRRRVAGAAGVAVAVVLTASFLVACGGASSNAQPPPPNAAATVTIKNIAFNPSTVTIKAGQTVAWAFDDGSIVHNVTFSGFRSNDQYTGYYGHTFTTPGTYHYSCTIHSGMAGTVIVTPATSATPAAQATTSP